MKNLESWMQKMIKDLDLRGPEVCKISELLVSQNWGSIMEHRKNFIDLRTIKN